MENSIQYRSAKMWQIRLYPLASGCSNAFMLLMMYVSYLMVGGYGVLAVATGGILTATRIFDGVTDPIVAFISDRFCPKKGKLRILLWSAWGIMAACCIILFYVGVGHGLVFFLIFYLLYIIGYTLLGVTDKIAATILTNDPKQRPLVSKWATIYTMVVMGVLSPVIMSMVEANGNEYSISTLRIFCAIILGVSAVMMALSTFAIAGKDTAENINLGAVKEHKTSIKDCLKVIKENRSLQMFIVAAASDKLALQTAGNTAFATLLFGVLIGKLTFSSIVQALVMPITIVGAFLAATMGIKKGNKHALVFWTWVAIIATAVTAVFYMLVDFRQIFTFSSFGGIIATLLFVVLTIARQVGQYGASAVNNAMLSDVADYENYRSGNFLPGTVGAAYTFVDKIVSAFATTVASLSLATIGYVSVMPQPTDEPTMAIRVLVTIMTLGLPILGWICTIIAMKFYPLTKEKMAEIQSAVAERNEARK